LNKKTGEIYTALDEDLHNADYGEDIGSYSGAALEKEKDILESDDWIQLPSQFDVHEWDIMRRFCYTIDDEALREELLNAIHGSGAFRMFKSVLRRNDLEDEWFAYRNKVFKEIATQWCKENEIEYEK